MDGPSRAGDVKRGHAVEGRVEGSLVRLPATRESVLAELRSLGVVVPAAPVRLGHYGDSASLSRELLELIRSGRKRAGTSLLWACEFDGESLPCVGDIEIVLDHLDRPAVVTRIVNVEVVRFDRVTAAYAAVEGEGDGSLAHWRRAHWSFFTRECHRISRQPLRSMSVVCGVFEVLQVVGPR